MSTFQSTKDLIWFFSKNHFSFSNGPLRTRDRSIYVSCFMSPDIPVINLFLLLWLNASFHIVLLVERIWVLGQARLKSTINRPK